MDINEIVNIIGTVGFPIVMCVLMFKNMTERDKATTEIVKQNTESITKLCEKVDRLLDSLNK